MNDTNAACLIFSDSEVVCNGTSYHVDEHLLGIHDTMFWVYLGVYVALTLGAGLMSGLTLGLLSLDTLSLEVLIKADSGKEAKYAKRLYGLVRHHHLLLVTLLLGNAACVESMPIFLDRISDPVLAILVSMSAVLLFGEIIPQALCKHYGLSIGYYMTPFVYFIMGLAFPIAWPISKLLDCIFGHNSSVYYQRDQLKALVDLHGPGRYWNNNSDGGAGPTYYGSNAMHHTIADGADKSVELGRPDSMGSWNVPPNQGRGQVSNSPLLRSALTHDEVTIIEGALDLTSKCARDAMVPLKNVFMISSTDVLDQETVVKVLCYAHSRIPVYRNTERCMIQGILITKMMLMLQLDSGGTPVKDLMSDAKCFRAIPYVTETTPLYDLLNLFQTGKCHMAVVVKDDIGEDEVQTLEELYRHREIEEMIAVPPPVLGIITLEDILEQLIQEPIEDESDQHRRALCRRLMEKQKLRRPHSRTYLLSGRSNAAMDNCWSVGTAERGEVSVIMLNRYLSENRVPTRTEFDERTPLMP